MKRRKKKADGGALRSDKAIGKATASTTVGRMRRTNDGFVSADPSDVTIAELTPLGALEESETDDVKAI